MSSVAGATGATTFFVLEFFVGTTGATGTGSTGAISL